MFDKKPWFMYPPVWLAVFLGAQWALDHYYPIGTWRVDLDSMPDTNVIAWLGGAIIVASVLKVLWLDLQFRRAKTTIIPYQESEALLDTGFYAYSRNPIYLAMVFVLFGAALIYGSFSVFIPVILFPIWINIRFIRAEERMLAEHFGEEYEAYKARVRRWI